MTCKFTNEKLSIFDQPLYKNLSFSNIVCYAYYTGGVIDSKDQYRDVLAEHPEWETRFEIGKCHFSFLNDYDKICFFYSLIVFSWAGEHFMPAEDPGGRLGPRLDDVLKYGPDDRVAQFNYRWDDERREQLLAEIDRILAAPPPPPLPPPGADTSEYLEAMRTDLIAASSVPVPAFGLEAEGDSALDSIIAIDDGCNKPLRLRLRLWLLVSVRLGMDYLKSQGKGCLFWNEVCM